MSVLSKLQTAATRAIELAALTSDLRERGLLEADQRLVARIRRVRAAEVIAATGSTPLLFGLARSRQPGESREEWAERVERELVDDPRLQQEAQKQQLATQTAVVALGVVALGTVSGSGEPEWESVQLDVRGGDPSVTVLGASLEHVHDEVIAFADLPFQRLGVAGVEAFPAQPIDADDEPGVGVLRPDAVGVPEPSDG